MKEYSDEILTILKRLIDRDAIQWTSVLEKNETLEVLRLYAIARGNL